MPIGGYYLKVEGADELKRALEGTARGIKDLSRAHREIGKMAGQYVLHNEPLPSGGGSVAGRNRGTFDGYLQAHTKGGGGKNGAWVDVQAPYYYVQEFGGTSYWYGGAGGMHGLIRKLDKWGGASYKHKRRKTVKRDLASIASYWGISGHTIYRKPRAKLGYFHWNVAYRIRDRIGNTYCRALEEIAAKNELQLEMMGGSLGLEPMDPPTR